MATDISRDLDGLIAGIRAAGDLSRLRLLSLCAQGDWTVSELTQCLGISQPLASRHLKLLVDAELVERRQEGSWVFCRLSRSGEAGRFARQLIRLIPSDHHLFRRDNERLAAIRRQRAHSASAFFRDLAAQWDEIRALHVGDAEVERALLALLPPDEVGDLLDIGTATGRVLELFGARGVNAVGIDLSREMLAVARANLARAGLSQCYVQQADMYDLPWPGPAFDAVTIHHVLHYADEPGRAIAEAARVLRPGGRIVIADFERHDREELRRVHAHRRLGFVDDEMKSWLAGAGLQAGATRRLPGTTLTICLWHARLPRAAAPISGNHLP
jgi:ArsR family transcriptional regulator